MHGKSAVRKISLVKYPIAIVIGLLILRGQELS